MKFSRDFYWVVDVSMSSLLRGAFIAGLVALGHILDCWQARYLEKNLFVTFHSTRPPALAYFPLFRQTG